MRKWPGLAAEVLEVADLQANFLVDFAVDGLLDAFPKLNQWRQALRERESVRTAVPSNFVDLYLERLRNNGAAVLKKAA